MLRREKPRHVAATVSEGPALECGAYAVASHRGEGGHAPRQPSIAEIAAQCGYEHASRFAGDYKRQFGMLPSETLREPAQLVEPVAGVA
jgi:AraC-like DNA-binding protein